LLDAENLRDRVLVTLDELKGFDLKVLDVRKLTPLTDYMVIASGTSDRHVRALARTVIEKAKEWDHPPLGVEGDREGEWVLVDLNDVVVHVMLPRVRDFYQLERLWTVPESAGTAVR
jgi:ribosome-associated protein